MKQKENQQLDQSKSFRWETGHLGKRWEKDADTAKEDLQSRKDRTYVSDNLNSHEDLTDIFINDISNHFSKTLKRLLTK